MAIVANDVMVSIVSSHIEAPLERTLLTEMHSFCLFDFVNFYSLQ